MNKDIKTVFNGTDTTLGIIAGLALAVNQTLDSVQEDEDRGNDGETDSVVSIKRRQSLSRTGLNPLVDTFDKTSVPPLSPLSTPCKKYTVHDQRDTIKKIQAQNQILKQELAIELRDAKNMLASDKRQRYQYLCTMIGTYNGKLEMIRKQNTKYDEQIQQKLIELETLRYENDTIQGDTTTTMLRRVRSLENRLELTLVKKNEMDSINKHLRMEIEKVRKDRVIFDGIYKKLEREKWESQYRLTTSRDELTNVLQAKERIQTQIGMIQMEMEQEQMEYEQQFQVLKTQLTIHGPHVPDSYETTSTFKQKKIPLRRTSISPLKRLSALSSWKIGFDKALSSTNDGILTKYIQVFDTMKQLTGITNVTKIAEALLHQDEENFKQFKRVEALHHEEERLQTQLEQLTSEIEAYKAQEGIATSTTQKQQYRVLENKYRDVLEKNQAFDLEYEEMTSKLTRIKSSIHSIHSMLIHANCAKHVDQFSQGNMGLSSHSARDVTDTNVLDYLQAIETFTSSLVRQSQENEERRQDFQPMIGCGPSTMSSDPSQCLRIQVPGVGGLNGVIILPSSDGQSTCLNDLNRDEEEEEEEEERAYTYEELKQFAAKHMIKKWEEPLQRRSSTKSIKN